MTGPCDCPACFFGDLEADPAMCLDCAALGATCDDCHAAEVWDRAHDEAVLEGPEDEDTDPVLWV